MTPAARRVRPFCVLRSPKLGPTHAGDDCISGHILNPGTESDVLSEREDDHDEFTGRTVCSQLGKPVNW